MKYNINLTGYSTTTRYYKISAEAKNFWEAQIKEDETLLTDYLSGDDVSDKVPEEAHFIEEDEDEYSCKALIEECEMIDEELLHLVVEDENNNQIIYERLFDPDKDEHLVEIKYNASTIKTTESLLCVYDCMKGCVFGDEIDVEEFDIRKLKINIDETVGGEDSLGSVTYDGQDLDNVNCCQRGKGRLYEVF